MNFSQVNTNHSIKQYGDSQLHSQSTLNFIATRLPPNVYHPLLEYTKLRRHDEVWNMNERLAGALNQQSSLGEWKYQCPTLEPYLLNLVEPIWNDVYTTCPWEFNSCKDITRFLKLHNLWVNYQKKNEYNPMHVHAGVVSFVIFVDIPYGWEERNNFYSDGAFQLEKEVLPVDNSWNGTILMFPSTTNHAVYPFRSTDKERTTVSGNIAWNVEGPDEEHY
tara:strand:- start:4661 stop:5320 length:660 start_codon:yes stop_codon:yes gene_type:complete